MKGGWAGWNKLDQTQTPLGEKHPADVQVCQTCDIQNRPLRGKYEEPLGNAKPGKRWAHAKPGLHSCPVDPLLGYMPCKPLREETQILHQVIPNFFISAWANDRSPNEVSQGPAARDRSRFTHVTVSCRCIRAAARIATAAFGPAGHWGV